MVLRKRALINAQIGGPLSGANWKTFAPSEPYRFWTPKAHIQAPRLTCIKAKVREFFYQKMNLA
jgi:hypothetical protein